MKKLHGLKRLAQIGPLRRPLLYTAAWAALLVWAQSAAHWPCVVAFMFLVVVVVLITAGLFEKARMRRRAWLGQYLHRGSPWRRWLRGGWLMRFRAALVALGLATVLLTQSLDLNVWYWALLLVNAWWLHLAQNSTQKRLQRQVQAQFLAPLTRLVVVPLNVVVLTGAWVV